MLLPSSSCSVFMWNEWATSAVYAKWLWWLMEKTPKEQKIKYKKLRNKHSKANLITEFHYAKINLPLSQTLHCCIPSFFVNTCMGSWSIKYIFSSKYCTFTLKAPKGNSKPYHILYSCCIQNNMTEINLISSPRMLEKLQTASLETLFNKIFISHSLDIHLNVYAGISEKLFFFF